MYTLLDIQYATFAKKKNNTKRNLLIGAGVLGSAALLAGGLALSRGKGSGGAISKVSKVASNLSDDVARTTTKVQQQVKNKADDVVSTAKKQVDEVPVKQPTSPSNPVQQPEIQTLADVAKKSKPKARQTGELLDKVTSGGTIQVQVGSFRRTLKNGKVVNVKGYTRKGRAGKKKKALVKDWMRSKKLSGATGRRVVLPDGTKITLITDGKLQNLSKVPIGKTFDDEFKNITSELGEAFAYGTQEQKQAFRDRYSKLFGSKFDDILDESIDLYNDTANSKDVLLKKARQVEDKLKQLNNDTLIEFPSGNFYQNKKVFEQPNAKIKRQLDGLYKRLQTTSDDIQPLTYSKKVLNGTYKKELDGKDINELLKWEEFVNTNKEFNDAGKFSQIGDSKQYIKGVLSNIGQGNVRAIKDTDGKLQAAATLAKDYTDSTGKSYTVVKYLATAPHNVLPNHPDKVKGGGSALIANLIQESIEKGNGGRLKIEGMSGTSLKFYERIGFKGNTLDEKSAQEFLSKLKQVKD